MAIDLNNFKLRIYEYVESRMTFIAPNLSMIIGKDTFSSFQFSLV